MDRPTKNGLIVESFFFLCFGVLVYWSDTGFKSMVTAYRGINRGFCNVTNIRWIDADCGISITQLPVVSGFFVFGPTNSEWKKHEKENSANTILRQALYPELTRKKRVGKHELTQAPEWTHVNITRWRSQFYTNMSQKWTSPYKMFPYHYLQSTCNSSSTTNVISAQLTRIFPWLTYYTPLNSTYITKMGYRECDLFQPANMSSSRGQFFTIYHQTDLKSMIGNAVAWVFLFIVTCLAVVPVKRRGDEPFKGLAQVFWELIKALALIPHVAIFWILTCCNAKAVEETYKKGSIFLPLFLWYLTLEVKFLQQTPNGRNPPLSGPDCVRASTPPPAPPPPPAAPPHSPGDVNVTVTVRRESQTRQPQTDGGPEREREREREREGENESVPRPSAPQLPVSANPPVYSDIDNEGVVIQNYNIPNPTLGYDDSAPPPSYEDVMADSSKV